MTPEDVDDIETGEQNSPLEPLFREHGVASVEELQEKLRKDRIANSAFAEMRNEAKTYKEQLAEKERELEELRDGLGSGSEDAVVREIRNLKRELSSVQKQVLAKPEDDELEPFMQLALEKKPWIKNLPTASDRMDAARTVALSLRAEKEAGVQLERGRSEGRAKADTISRTYVERSGGTSFGGGGQTSEDGDLAKYEKELDAAAGNQAKMDSINRKFRAKYPHWGI